MENASKALLMAGGILISIIIIALLARSFGTVRDFQMSRLTEEEQAELIAFNEQYTQYLNQYVYGTEVLTLQNKYKNDNQVEVIVEGEQPLPTDNQYMYNEMTNSYFLISDNQYMYNETTNSYSNETRYYKCTEIEYDNSTGRVNKITFEQIKLNSVVEDDEL